MEGFGSGLLALVAEQCLRSDAVVAELFERALGIECAVDENDAALHAEAAREFADFGDFLAEWRHAIAVLDGLGSCGRGFDAQDFRMIEEIGAFEGVLRRRR